MPKNKTNVENILKDFETKQDIVKLEKFYVDSQIDNLEELVETRKQEIVKDISNFCQKNTTRELDQNGTVLQKFPTLNEYVISNYFFRSIVNLQNIEPKYSGEQLSIIWDLYNYLVLQVNMHLKNFTPTLSHFCKFIGVTTSGFKKMRKSSDENIRVVVEKIYDALYDENVKQAEIGNHNTRATIYRMKSEMDKLEKEAPSIVIKTESVDMEEIQKRINEINNFNTRVTEAEYEEK